MAGTRTRKISARTKALLEQGESGTVDFKLIVAGVSNEDFVSFANAVKGGSILVGVREVSGKGGVQIGVVEGCDVADATILQITNRALGCIPPIAIIVTVENLDRQPFLRIDIPSSTTKPHCTPKGVYCVRDGSRNRALHPSELLKIFVESESRAFAKNFEAAADRISLDLSELQMSLDRSIRSMGDQLGWADSKLDETEWTLDSVLSSSRQLNRETAEISTRLRALFRQDGREDPVRAKTRKETLDKAVEQLSGDADLLRQIAEGATISMKADGKAGVELDEDDLRAILREAVEIVSSQRNTK